MDFENDPIDLHTSDDESLYELLSSSSSRDISTDDADKINHSDSNITSTNIYCDPASDFPAIFNWN